MPGEGQDSLFVLSDYVSHGHLEGRRHNGSLADVLLGVEHDDRITILGCATDDLNVVELEHGYGIHAHGVLEAVIMDSEISKSEIIDILSGDSTVGFS